MKKSAFVPPAKPAKRAFVPVARPQPPQRKAALVRRVDPEQVLREKLLAYRGLTSYYPPVMGRLDSARKERFVDWMIHQPHEFLVDLAEILSHLSQHGQEAVFLASMLRTLASHRKRTGT